MISWPHVRGATTVLLVLGAGCVEATRPTSPRIEQGVFNALGGLEIGETMVLTGSAAAQALVGGTASARGFVYIPFNSNRARTSIQLEIRGDNLGSTPSSGLLPAPPGTWLRSGRDPHLDLLEHQRRAVVPLLRAHRASTAASRSIATPRSSILPGGTATVGQLVQINANALGDPCDELDARTGRVEAITTHAIIVADTTNPVGGLTRGDYEEAGALFDSLVQPTLTSYFSDPTDIDSNGRVIIFYTRAVNELTGPDDEGFIGGFFWARDLFPAADCPGSNESEIFFVLAADPDAIASPIRHTREEVLTTTVGTVGHEYEHLINAGRRIYINEAEDFEETWLDEGLAHIAEELLFYADSGLSPRANLTLDDIRRPGVLEAFNRYGIENLGRYSVYLEDVTREAAANDDDDLATRGAAWAFLRYLADHVGESDEEFFSGLVNTRFSGYENLSQELGTEPLDWLRRWGVSVYADDHVATTDAQHQQPSWNFRSVLPAVVGSGFPLEVERLASGQTVNMNLLAATSGYVLFSGIAGDATTLFTASGQAAPPNQLQVTILRTH